MIVTNAKHGFAAGLPWRNISLLEKNLDQDNTPTIPRTDYVANPNAKTYAVAVDPFRKLDGQKTSFLMMMIDSVIIL